MRTVQNPRWAGGQRWGTEGLVSFNEEGIAIGVVRLSDGSPTDPPIPLSDVEIDRLIGIPGTAAVEWTVPSVPSSVSLPALSEEDEDGDEGDEDMPVLAPEPTPLEVAIATVLEGQILEHLASLVEEEPLVEEVPLPVKPLPANFLARTVPVLLPEIARLERAEDLQELAQREQAGKGRKMILEAVADRLLALSQGQ